MPLGVVLVLCSTLPRALGLCQTRMMSIDVDPFRFDGQRDLVRFALTLNVTLVTSIAGGLPLSSSGWFTCLFILELFVLIVDDVVVVDVVVEATRIVFPVPLDAVEVATFLKPDFTLQLD